MNAHANAEDGDEERPKAEARNTHKRPHKTQQTRTVYILTSGKVLLAKR
mgnify:CR=1 FL=1